MVKSDALLNLNLLAAWYFLDRFTESTDAFVAVLRILDKPQNEGRAENASVKEQ